MLAVFIQGQDLDRNVAHGGVLLQMIEHGPTQHVWQEDIQGNGHGMELTRQCERFSTPSSNQHLESLVSRQIAEQAGVVRIILDNQQNGVGLLKACTIIFNGLDAVFECDCGNQLRRR